MADAGPTEMSIQYAALSIPKIRDMRQNGQAENHLYNLLHRGYAGIIGSGEGRIGDASCPFEFYKNWVTDPAKTQADVEKLTRKYPGVKSAPIDGIPYK